MASGYLTIPVIAVLLSSVIIFADGVAVKDVLKEIQSLKTTGPLHVTIAVLNSRGRTYLSSRISALQKSCFELRWRHCHVSVFVPGNLGIQAICILLLPKAICGFSDCQANLQIV